MTVTVEIERRQSREKDGLVLVYPMDEMVWRDPKHWKVGRLRSARRWIGIPAGQVDLIQVSLNFEPINSTHMDLRNLVSWMSVGPLSIGEKAQTRVYYSSIYDSPNIHNRLCLWCLLHTFLQCLLLNASIFH